MAEEFKVLSDREHVLARSGVYLGSSAIEDNNAIIDYMYCTKRIVPALIKMIDEIISNSIDESIRTQFEFANEISVDITNTVDGCEISVSDNGRGIPVEQVGGQYRPVLAWTALRAGSNFDDSVRVGAGTNGMGSALTNIFSTRFEAVTCDGKSKLTLICSDNMDKIDYTISKGKVKGTSVKFVPDLSRFNLSEFTQDHIDVIRDRISNLSISYPKIAFKFNGEKFVFKNFKTISKKFHDDCISFESEKYGILFAPSGDDSDFRCLSYVNGLCNKNGGSHIDYIVDMLSGELRELIKKKHKIEVMPAQIKSHLLVAVYARDFLNLKFDSQTKDRITNSRAEVKEYFSDFSVEKIAKQIIVTPSIIDPMIAAILFKKELAEQMLMAKKEKAAKKLNIANHISAQSKNTADCSLFLAEGLSAVSGALAVRDKMTQGFYPLRGKVLNVRNKKPIEILKNKEIFELLAILGLKFNQPATDMNYGKIVVMTDADYDGHAIFCQLLNLFSFWPELFSQGRIYRLNSPLYVCTKGKQTKYFYDMESFKSANLKGWECDYAKGLGSLSKDAYRDMLQNPNLTRVTEDDMLASLELAFGNSADARKDWMLA